jgi:hypothetical protein
VIRDRATSIVEVPLAEINRSILHAEALNIGRQGPRAAKRSPSLSQ